jgi:CopG family nickel-responsive transcriptional regulator
MTSKEKVHRISVSLPESLCRDLDRLLEDRGFQNRSQAIADMVRQELVEDKYRQGDQVMAGTLTLVYSESINSLRAHLMDIARQHIAEVISSLHVMLEDSHTLEVWLVQGPATRLNCIRNKILACRGVKTCKLTLTAEVLPPLHARNA